MPSGINRDIDYWRDFVRPAIRARQIRMAERVIDKVISDGYLTDEDYRQLAYRLAGAQ